MPKISIIVPVYNTEKYLRRCLDSILAQTYTNFEVILIDDGSTDSSGQICDEYVKKRSNFVVYHIDNGGPSRARNKGLECAQGLYVTFVDGDDWLEEDALKRYILAIESHQADVVKAGYRKEYNKRSVVVKIDQEEKYTDLESFFVGIEKSKYYGFLWNGIYKRSVIGNIRMDETIRWCEDHMFTCEVLLQIKKLVLIPDVLYHYRKTERTTLSAMKDPWLIFSIANREYEQRQVFVVSKGGAAYTLINDAYDGKMYQAINALYQVKPYCERKRFKEVTLPQLKTDIKDNLLFILKVFYSNGPFFIVDLKIRLYRFYRNLKSIIKDLVENIIHPEMKYV